MKLEILFSQFLYQHKKLVLPGIGTFILDPATAIPEDADKQKFAVAGITFDQKSSVQIDENLIDFVRTHTGKIRPLAVSDIESFSSLSTQLLNIGNPLYIEGIGTLIKGKDGRLNFTPGSYVATRLEDMTIHKEATAEPRGRASEDTFARHESGNNARKILIAAAAIITLGIIGGGAYYLYQGNAHKKNVEAEPDTLASQVITDTTTVRKANAYVPDSSLVKKDTSAVKLKTDSTVATVTQSSNVPNAGGMLSLKYILETTANKSRALKRYKQLKGFGNDIHMDVSADSSSYKLYFIIPSVLADTAHIKDSLTRYFQNKVKIEK